MVLVTMLLPGPNAVSLAVMSGRVTGVLKAVVALSS
jgi:chromate transport protein ChrA